MKNCCLIVLCCLMACSAQRPAPTALIAPPARSGIDLQYVDPAVRAQDDLYRHLNGKWLDTFQIPADKATYNSFLYVDDQTQEELRHIVEELSNGPTAEDPSADPDARKLADLFASFMDEPTLEVLGTKPLDALFAQIDALSSPRQLAPLVAQLDVMSVGTPLALNVSPDPRSSSRYAVSLRQSGLGMPDRDYYLSEDAKLKDARQHYVKHVETMLGLTAQPHPDAAAASILKLETALAQLQWTRVANRDPIKTYNKTAIASLGALVPAFDWPAYFNELGITGKTDYVIVGQPSYFEGLSKLMADVPLGTWKSYLKWRVLSAAAPYMSKTFVDERFAFTGTVLRGIPENRPRWKRGVSFIDDAMGEALGKLYVARYFPPQSKARMDALVSKLLDTYRQDIETLDWMEPATKRGAQDKLAKMVTKIGYPDVWRDYGALRIERGDLWGNVLRANRFESQRVLNKLGQPVDRKEWFMTPQTINAYYAQTTNEIVFPAAILQPPFFDPKADDAVNFGAIVAVIGHEISHAFDDKGSQYDGDGNLHDWFTPEDHERFAAKTRAMVAQYAAYEPVPGFHLNGELTLGENIADNSGLAVAYKAYHLSLGGSPAPVIDGMTGVQRLYYGWTQLWRGKARQAEALQRIKVDPHSPSEIRGTATIVNQAGFYAAFDVKPGDQMYVAPEARISIW